MDEKAISHGKRRWLGKKSQTAKYRNAAGGAAISVSAYGEVGTYLVDETGDGEHCSEPRIPP